jgi:hypothetical protein
MTVRPACLLFTLSTLIVAGCGGGRPAVVPAGGKVMYNKTTPPVGALVVFHPASLDIEKQIGGKPVGKVKEDGTFTLTTYEEGDGAPEGEYGVTIDWRGPPKAGKLSLSGEGEGDGGGAPRLKPKYSNPQQPFTKVTVKKGEANQFTFEVD